MNDLSPTLPSFERRTHLPVPADWPPTLAVVVDTEEEFDFDNANDFGNGSCVANVGRQAPGQDVLERNGIVPTYVLDYPAARCPGARALIRPLLQAGRCDIGAHLHPWVNPPENGPVDECRSYPGNLPPALERAKLERLTDCIEEEFGRRPIIYKAGRYGVGPATARILEELGYRIDISVVPRTDFSGRHGPDFRDFPDEPFRLSPSLIGLPLSVGFAGALASSGPRLYPTIDGPLGKRFRLGAFAARLGLLERLRLSPEGHSLNDMRRHVTAAIETGQRLFMLTYHSSSLLPGATPYVRNEVERVEFLERLDGFCRFFMTTLGGRASTVHDVAELLTGETLTPPSAVPVD